MHARILQVIFIINTSTPSSDAIARCRVRRSLSSFSARNSFAYVDVSILTNTHVQTQTVNADYVLTTAVLQIWAVWAPAALWPDNKRQEVWMECLSFLNTVDVVHLLCNHLPGDMQADQMKHVRQAVGRLYALVVLRGTMAHSCTWRVGSATCNQCNYNRQGRS